MLLDIVLLWVMYVMSTMYDHAVGDSYGSGYWFTPGHECHVNQWTLSSCLLLYDDWRDSYVISFLYTLN